MLEDVILELREDDEHVNSPACRKIPLCYERKA